jgi:hypothetical protein
VNKRWTYRRDKWKNGGRDEPVAPRDTAKRNKRKAIRLRTSGTLKNLQMRLLIVREQVSVPLCGNRAWHTVWGRCRFSEQDH